jgi:membrane protease YdiL (CAAX protease family)
MTATAVATPRPTWPTARTVTGAIVVVLGCVFLASRPVLAPRLFGAADAPLVLIGGFLLLLVAGACWPLDPPPNLSRQRPPSGRSRDRLGVAGLAGAVGVGLGAFALGRLVGGGHPAVPVGAFVIATNTLAAVAEEAFFRRLCFGLLEPAGVGWAIVGSSVLFAAVHVSTYGLWVLPLDLAAGLVLGWQRAATGSWAAPAVTHVLVNLMVVL